jgi:hypothetical protein
MSDAGSVFAVFSKGEWVPAQRSVLELFGGEDEVGFDGHWPRAGALRAGRAGHRIAAHDVPRGEDRLWPTPAASLPNDGEEPAQWLHRFVLHAAKEDGATRAGVPLSVAARAPIVLRVAKVGAIAEAKALLERHAQETVAELMSTERLNPRWVEMLMGFPEGWSDVSPQSSSS